MNGSIFVKSSRQANRPAVCICPIWTVNSLNKHIQWDATIFPREGHKRIYAPFPSAIDKLRKAIHSGLLQILRVNFSLEILGPLSTNLFYRVVCVLYFVNGVLTWPCSLHYSGYRNLNPGSFG